MADDSEMDVGSTDADAQDRTSSAPTKKTKREKVRKIGERMSEAGQQTLRDVASESRARSNEPSPNSTPRYVNVDNYKRGGTVRRTGKARLHKNEVVVGRGKRRGGKRRRMSGRS
jgi:hypothetical protein